MNRLQDIKKFMSTELKEAGIAHLFLRRCLRIGDAGFHNILEVDESCSLKQKVAGIDLEEFNSKSGDSKDNYELLDNLVNKHSNDPMKVLKSYLQYRGITFADSAKCVQAIERDELEKMFEEVKKKYLLKFI